MTEPGATRRGAAALGALTAVLALLAGCGPDRAPAGDPVRDAQAPTGAGRVPAGALFVAPDGRNVAAGTAREPLRTLRAAVGRAHRGQAIVLRGGTYRQSAGVIRKQVRISAYPGERVWFKGSDVITGWRSVDGAWEHAGWHPPLCRTCHLPGIIDPAYPLAGRPDMVFADGVPLRQVATRSAVGPGRFFVDDRAQLLVIGSDPAQATIEATTRSFLAQFDGAAAGSVLRDIGVAQYGSNQDYGNHGAMVIVNTPRVRLLNDTFAYSASTGVLVTKPRAVLRGNSFVHNGLAGLVANLADRIRLVDNEFRANNAEHFALTGDSVGAAGAKITHTARAYVVHNRFVGNAANGWWCDLGCTDTVVVGNLAQDNAGNGLYYEVSSRALIVSNAVLGNQRGLKVSSSDGVRIYHNSFAGNASAVGLYNDPRPVTADPYSAAHGLSWRTTGTELVNNMFTVPSGAGPLVDAGDIAGKPVGRYVSLADGNGYLSIGPQAVDVLAAWLVDDAVTPFGSLPALRARTGAESHGLTAVRPSSPFADAAAGDLALAPSAPGNAAGVPTPPDIAAAAGVRPSDHPDIGILAPPG